MEHTRTRVRPRTPQHASCHCVTEKYVSIKGQTGFFQVHPERQWSQDTMATSPKVRMEGEMHKENGEGSGIWVTATWCNGWVWKDGHVHGPLCVSRPGGTDFSCQHWGFTRKTNACGVTDSPAREPSTGERWILFRTLNTMRRVCLAGPETHPDG